LAFFLGFIFLEEVRLVVKQSAQKGGKSEQALC